MHTLYHTELADGLDAVECAKYNIGSGHLVYLPGEQNTTVFPSEFSLVYYKIALKLQIFIQHKQSIYSAHDTHVYALYYDIMVDGITPDGTARNVTVSFHLGLTITYYTIAAVGIVFTTICLAFNIKYRNTR